MEAAEIGIFMLSASLLGSLLEHPASPVRAMIPSPGARRVLMGLAMGATALAIVHSPFGKRSGAHFNPAVTLTYWRLGRIRSSDAAFYALSQLVGAIAGMLLASAILGGVLAHPDVNHVRTLPGPRGPAPAIAAEIGMTFILMSIVLEVSSRPRIARFTGLYAACLVAIYIPLLAPVSGMSMNPARSAGSAVAAGSLEFLWVYFTAPLAGMLLAAEGHRLAKGTGSAACAKLHHQNAERCIFCGRV
jgi:aquaporin Z